MLSNSIEIDEQIVVITGGGAGIGKAITLGFLEANCTVVVLEKNTNSIQQLSLELMQFKDHLHCIEVDLANEEQIEKAFSHIENLFGKIDVLVNNAGILQFGPTDSFSFQDWKKIIMVNLDAVFLASQLALRIMLKNHSGNIINIASSAGLVGFDQAAAYVSSKHAVVGLTKALAVEYGQKNIRINAICPGDTLTAMSSKYTAEELKDLIAKHPIGRIGVPHEIADVAVFLASDKASFMTGAIIAADGGYTAV